jgi:hypothetical protein
MQHRRIAVALAGIALISAACSGGSGTSTAPSAAASAPASEAPSAAATSAAPSAAATLGPGEGELNLVAWTQYVGSRAP